MAQCAFEVLVFKISAVHTIYRSWLRSSSIYEPSDPPIRLEIFSLKNCNNGQFCWRRPGWRLIKSHDHEDHVPFLINTITDRGNNCSEKLRRQAKPQFRPQTSLKSNRDNFIWTPACTISRHFYELLAMERIATFHRRAIAKFSLLSSHI